MRMHGMILNAIDIQKKLKVTDECKKLCDKLLSGNYEIPIDSFFEEVASNQLWIQLPRWFLERGLGEKTCYAFGCALCRSP